jgi:hypothetical protein
MLVASSLLLHAALGCCWHHEHSPTCCEPLHIVPVAIAGCHQHDCIDHCDADHDQPSPTPCDGDSHCPGDCNYLAVQKSQLDQVQISLPLDFAAISAPPSHAADCTAHNLAQLYELDTGPPQRLHLALQVLLI